ncbi:multicomponent Na+:H+ antiporter subunit F [Devosia enhydra]|uniref:Multicomponent Na+:H+ antiporter subunit F n=1 Tax=Devosia enhydra TaxID=665118 RepID=A0A1K2I0V6_9HYPH|nr:cation:proton antiporter [Devosia enhydra]SFZ85903.1 multicomponent Na+:H+ antiporter subunit F [Devosia enhydra]
MSAMELLYHATTFGMVMLLLALFFGLVRLWRGPSLADRILALDTLSLVGLALIAVFALRTLQMAYLDIAISLGLVGFLATVALSRYLMHRETPAQQPEQER